MGLIVSTSGATFEGKRNHNAASDDPNDPAALDLALKPMLEPYEYMGIAWYGDDVWTAYGGTWEEDPQDNDAVIWSSQIDCSELGGP